MRFNSERLFEQTDSSFLGRSAERSKKVDKELASLRARFEKMGGLSPKDRTIANLVFQFRTNAENSEEADISLVYHLMAEGLMYDYLSPSFLKKLKVILQQLEEEEKEQGKEEIDFLDRILCLESTSWEKERKDQKRSNAFRQLHRLVLSDGVTFEDQVVDHLFENYLMTFGYMLTYGVEHKCISSRDIPGWIQKCRKSKSPKDVGGMIAVINEVISKRKKDLPPFVILESVLDSTTKIDSEGKVRVSFLPSVHEKEDKFRKMICLLENAMRCSNPNFDKELQAAE